MELSPRARERLASIGELSSEEKEKAKYSDELDILLADYFTGKLTGDGLWRKLRQYLDDGKNNIVSEAQLKILSPVVLSSSSIVFERYRNAILGCEVLKAQSNYTEIEAFLNDLEAIQKTYYQERDVAFENMKRNMRAQIEAAAHKVASKAGNRQAAIDIDASVEASLKTSPEWRDFMQKHDNSFGPRFGNQKEIVRRQINK